MKAFHHRATGLRDFSSETTDKPTVRGFGTAGMGFSDVCEWVVNCVAVSLKTTEAGVSGGFSKVAHGAWSRSYLLGGTTSAAGVSVVTR